MPGPVRGDSTNAFLETSDGVFDDWEEYTVTSDLLDPSDSFSFSKPVPPSTDGKRDPSSKRRVRKGNRIALKVASEKGTALQLRGRVWNVTTQTDRSGGSEIHAHGFDHMKPIVNADVMPGLTYSGTFAGLIRQALAPFGYAADDIIIDNSANRGFLVGKNVTYAQVPAPDGANVPDISGPATVATGITIDQALSRYATADGTCQADGIDISRAIFAASVGTVVDVTIDVVPPPRRLITVKSLDSIPIEKARAHVGETVYAFLSRHALRFNLLMWGTADGKIVFGRPDYAQAPLYSFVCLDGAAGQARNNVESISRVESIEHRPSEINVYGHSYGGDAFASPAHAVVYDADVQALGIYQPITIHDTCAKSKKDADQRAQHELSLRRQTSDVVRVVVKEHASSDGSIFAIDTVANVEWDAGNVHGPMYVIRRTFTRTKHGGARTQIDLVPLYSIVLGDPSA